ncbi:MAG: RNA polymerase sigma factor [Myxococcales bacterium]
MSLTCLRHKHKPIVEEPVFGCRPEDRWTTLYRTHRWAVYARCKRLLRDQAAAEDAAHETFARALRHLADISEPEEQRRWLLCVATNYCRNQLRDGKRQRELLVQFDRGPECEEADTFAGFDLEAYLTRSVPRQVVRVAWLSFVQEMGQHQVAVTLGISRRTVVNRLATFRAHARQAMVGYTPR